MDRVCIDKTTGKVIGYQSGGDDRPDLMEMRLDTLRINAINAGYKEDQIEVKWVTDAEFQALIAPSAEELAAQAKKQAINAIQTILDNKARELGFDTIHTAAAWTISKNVKRKARADALVTWGDKVWDFAEAEWEKQGKGESTFKTVDEFLRALPVFVAP